MPKECRFNTEEVAVNRVGDIVMLIPMDNKWDNFIQAIDMFTEDFMENGRENQLIQEREEI